MIVRRSVLALLFLAACGGTEDASPSTGGGRATGGGGSTGGGGATGAFRDWTAHPAVIELDTTEDVYVLGDVHADPQTAGSVLAGAGLIASVPATPSQAQWTGGHAVLVFMGDPIDKYSDALGALTLARTLEASAAAAGGRVIVLVGNHEAEFLADPTDTKAEEFASELTSAGLSAADVAAGRVPLGVELRNRPFAARINSFFLAHAGNSGGLTLTQLDQALRSGLDARGFAAPILQDADSLLDARLSPSPWWETSGFTPASLGAGITHVVLGHQPGKVTFSDGTTRAAGAMYVRLGEFFLVDTGMSRGIGHSSGAVLLLHRTASGTTQAQEVSPSGAKTLLWEG